MDDESGEHARRADAARPHTAYPAHPQDADESPSPVRGEGLRVTPNKNRIVQVRRTGGRKLFDKARKEVFLEWFAATCNVALSAGKAGVCDKTVYKHLLKDPAFEEAALRALRLGYFRLEARELQEAHQLRFGQSGTSAEDHPSTAFGGPPPHPAKPDGEEYIINILDDEVVEEHFDPVLALQLLREHRRQLPGSADGRKNQRTTARSATNKEIAEALAKRLKGFGLRVSKEAPPPGDARSPSPSLRDRED
jgi:hypothetical protein